MILFVTNIHTKLFIDDDDGCLQIIVSMMVTVMVVVVFFFLLHVTLSSACISMCRIGLSLSHWAVHLIHARPIGFSLITRSAPLPCFPVVWWNGTL